MGMDKVKIFDIKKRNADSSLEQSRAYDLLRVIATILVVVGHCTYFKICTNFKISAMSNNYKNCSYYS